MAQYKDIELSSIGKVRLYRPPYLRLQDSVRRRDPEPEPPVKTTTTKAGRTLSGPPLYDDPDYKAAHAAWQARYDEEVDKMGSLFMFQDVRVPDDWTLSEETIEIMRYFEPDWAPNEGKIGRKLDYIQWYVLAEASDAILVTNTLNEMVAIDLEEVNANEASFPDQVEEPSA